LVFSVQSVSQKVIPKNVSGVSTYRRRCMTTREVHILLAEDNDGDVFLVRRALQKQGLSCQLEVAHNGEEAMQLLEAAEDGPSADAPELILDVFPYAGDRAYIVRLPQGSRSRDEPGGQFVFQEADGSALIYATGTSD
jgi:hypothetical protein